MLKEWIQIGTPHPGLATNIEANAGANSLSYIISRHPFTDAEILPKKPTSNEEIKGTI